jgi:hypothetical protein
MARSAYIPILDCPEGGGLHIVSKCPYSRDHYSTLLAGLEADSSNLTLSSCAVRSINSCIFTRYGILCF